MRTCLTPKQKFSLKTGTVFEDSPHPAREMASRSVADGFLQERRIRSYEVHRGLGVTQKSDVVHAASDSRCHENWRLWGCLTSWAALMVAQWKLTRLSFALKPFNMHHSRRLPLCPDTP